MNKNRYYRITRNHGNELPSQIISIGVGTKVDGRDGSHILSHCHLIAERRRKTGWHARREVAFTKPADVWDWIRSRCQRKEPVWVFAHGWHGAAVVTGFWEEMDHGRFSVGLPERKTVDENGIEKTIKAWQGLLAIESRPFVVFACCPSGTVKLVDVSNYFNLSADELADSFGIDGPMASDDAGPETVSRCDAERTALAVHTSMTRTITAWADGDRGNWQPTAGRLAYSNYRHSFMPEHSIDIDEDKMDREFHREALFGGEGRVWFRGKIDGPLYKVDVTGLYPAMMLDGSFPYKIESHHEPASILGRTEPIRPSDCIARCVVRCDGDIAMRREDGSVDYPVGRTLTTLCGEELAVAVRTKRVDEWIGWTQFTCGPIFAHYVQYWWAIRKQAKATGDAATDALAKLMLNCLYGVFAKRRSKWTLTTKMDAPIRWGSFLSCATGKVGFQRLRAIAGNVQVFNGLEETEGTFPAIAALVTSAARLYMRRIRALLPKRSVLNQQTDSLLLTHAGFEALKQTDYWNPGELGCFRLVDTFEYADIRGSNHYTTDHSECLAGVPLNRRKVGDFTWQAELTESTSEFIERNGKSNDLHVKKCEYVVIQKPSGHRWHDDGWAYEPDEERKANALEQADGYVDISKYCDIKKFRPVKISVVGANALLQ